MLGVMTVITRTDRRWFGSALHSGTLNLNVMMRISIGVQRQFVVCSAYAALCGATPMIIGAQAAPLKLGGMVQVGRMHEFTRVSGAAIGPGSLLAISQPRDAQVLLFDLTAGDKPLAVLGRPGEGPGEFSRPGAMGWFNGALWVSDAGRPRVEWFDRRGRLTESAQYPAPPSPSTLYRYVAPMGIQRDSSMLYFPTVNLGSAERMGTDPGTPFPVLRVDGTRVDTIAQLRLLLAQLTLHGDRDGGRAGSYATQPFTHQNFVEVGANGERVLLVLQAAVGVGDDATELRMLAADGTTVFRRTLRLPQRPVSDAEWEELIERWATYYSRDVWSTKALAARGLRNALIRPATHPLVDQAVLGFDGTTWLRLEGDAKDVARWLVIDAGGSDVGIARIPRTVRVIDASRKRVIGVITDGYDVERVVCLPVN